VSVFIGGNDVLLQPCSSCGGSPRTTRHW
jgi:hypothetical protein